MFRGSESFTVCLDEQINILHTELRKKAFAYLPGKTKLFKMNLGEKETEGERTKSSR